MQTVREVLAGRYERLDEIGRGGMGVVYRARDRVLDRTVAVKVLPAESAGDPALVARFEREARAAGALNHPNIVAVFDTGRERDTHFIVMEYVAGRSLTQLVRDRGPAPPDRARAIGAQIAGALAEAHRAGIIHRDIKPANVMVDDSGRVKVLDFGIARATDGTSLTQAAVVLGSAPYLAPEVTRGEPADERSDIYSLGCLLYELLSGHPPFTGEHAAAVMHQHNSTPPRPLRERNPKVPPELDALVLQMLAKQPGDRPQSAEQAAAALGATAGQPTKPTEPTRRLTPTRPVDATRPLAPEQRFTPTRNYVNRRRWAVAALGALIVVAALIALLGSSGGQPAPTSTGHAAKTPRSTARGTTTAATRSTPTSTSASTPASTSTPATTQQSQSPPATVAAAAGALAALLAQDIRSGAVDEHGQDLMNHLQDALNSYQQGHGDDALHKVDDLAKQVGDLGTHGNINSSALPAITAGVANLRAAILRSPTTSSQGSGAAPQAPQPPPQPPAKAHGHGHGKGGGKGH